MKILMYFALGATIGGVSGMLGIGGGVLLVPALMWLFGHDQRQAAGITLAVLAVPVVLPGVWQYYARGLIRPPDLVAAAWIAAAFAVGTYLGARMQIHLPLAVLRLGFGLLMIYVAMRFIVNSHAESANAAAGLAACTFAWLGYFGLRLLGRKHLPPSAISEHIRAAADQRPGEIDYHI